MTAATILDASSNLLIRALDVSDRQMVAFGCQRIVASRGQRIIDPLKSLDGLYFPETTILSLTDVDTKGEIAVIGREGFAGWGILLGCAQNHFLADTCTRDGTLLRMSLDAVQIALAKSRTFRSVLLPYVDLLTSQMAANGQSHARDRVMVRIARWIKMRHDRVPGDEIFVRHAEIAQCLIVRRASVTDALHLFEGDAILRCRRGRIIVRDATRLSSVCNDRSNSTGHTIG